MLKFLLRPLKLGVSLLTNKSTTKKDDRFHQLWLSSDASSAMVRSGNSGAASNTNSSCTVNRLSRFGYLSGIGGLPGDASLKPWTRGVRKNHTGVGNHNRSGGREHSGLYRRRTCPGLAICKALGVHLERLCFRPIMPNKHWDHRHTGSLKCSRLGCHR